MKVRQPGNGNDRRAPDCSPVYPPRCRRERARRVATGQSVPDAQRRITCQLEKTTSQDYGIFVRFLVHNPHRTRRRLLHSKEMSAEVGALLWFTFVPFPLRKC